MPMSVQQLTLQRLYHKIPKSQQGVKIRQRKAFPQNLVIGRTILYATNGKIKKVGNVDVNSLKIKGSRQNSNFDNIIPQNSEKSTGNENSSKESIPTKPCNRQNNIVCHKRQNKKVGNVEVNSLKIKGSRQNSNFDNIIPQNSEKSIDNEKLSLSSAESVPAKHGNYNVYGEDIALVAPVREDIAKNATTTEGTVSKTGHVDDIAPIADAEATANITSKKLSFREEFGEGV